MIYLRDDVRSTGLKTEALLGMLVAERAAASVGYDIRITSIVEGQHSLKSLHPVGYAFDLEILGIPGGALVPVEYARVAKASKAALGPDYDVVYEASPLHLHIEYQPKRGLQSIPPR